VRGVKQPRIGATRSYVFCNIKTADSQRSARPRAVAIAESAEQGSETARRRTRFQKNILDEIQDE
jgi:hypothetical protein